MTDEAPLVSIIIPSYNYARYLPAAIESALAQTYRPVEVIVVDDGSIDDSLQVARSYPVRVLSQPNQGLSTSGNNGIRAARGAYVVRLDADDVLYPTFIEETVQALRRSPHAVLAHTDAEYFGNRHGRVPFEPFNPESLAQGAYATGTALFSRSALVAVGGFDEDLPVNEDWDLWLAFAERQLGGVMVRKVLWGYRQHGPSMVKRAVRSLTDVRREYRLIARLQDNHPALFARRHLIRRLRSVPHRLAEGSMRPRIAARLLAFYAVMLVRVGVGLHRPRERVPLQTSDSSRTPTAPSRSAV